jgi:flagellum-specific peptidoglycan hydrolase FlgJ
MLRKISFLILVLLIVSCGGSKPVAGGTNKPYRKPATTIAAKAKKPVAARPVTRKPVTQKTTNKNNPYQGAKEENKSTSSQSVYSKSEILEATTRVKVTTAMVMEYIDTYKDIAKNNMTQFGIPASITLGQGILESGAGTGPLSTLANNHFGIKCHKEWTGPSVSYDDDEAQECFRKYDQPSQSYQDHSTFLTSRDRYASLFELDKDDYTSWARGLKAAGYATDPRYPEKLIGIIERYQLAKYDSEVLGTEYVPVRPVLPIVKDPIQVNSEIYQVMQGDTLYSISKKFNLSVDELRKKNNISENSISIGQNLKIK